MSEQVLVIGAGITGCLAGLMLPNAKVAEAKPEFQQNHHALLRFRSTELSKATAIPFQQVQVHKSIWYDGRHIPAANPQLANWYSKKCTGEYLSRSIWNLDTVQRWVAPPDFHARLADRCGDRIQYGSMVESIDSGEHNPVVSTLPMPVLARILGKELDCEFKFSPIQVDRYTIPGANLHQTVYYPDPDLGVYRASIVRDQLIVESRTDHLTGFWGIEEVFNSFGIEEADTERSPRVMQEFGKLVPVDDVLRKQFIYQATVEHRVFSLGRYAIWKDVLLDEVYEDLSKVREMIAMSPYDIARRAV